METHRPRWLVPLVAACAVLAVLVVTAVVARLMEDQPPSDGTVGTARPRVGSGGDPAAGAIPATGYHSYGATRLALVYTNGVPACYGSPGTPVVEESPTAVTVTIPRMAPPKSDGDTACIDLAVVGSVDVTLQSPLGDREVLDGSRDGAVLPRQSLPGEDPAV